MSDRAEMSKVLRKDYKSWPTKPFLPLVDHSVGLENGGRLGLIIHGHGDKVFICNLLDAFIVFSESGGSTKTAEFKKWLGTLASLHYENFDAVLADGWEVD